MKKSYFLVIFQRIKGFLLEIVTDDHILRGGVIPLKPKAGINVKIFIFILVFLSIFQQINTIASIEELKPILNTKDSINLFIQQNIEKAEIKFRRIISLSKEWDILFLNLTVQNNGDPLENVFLSTSMNEKISEYSFESYNREQTTKRLVHQFEQRQSLISPLNYSFDEIQTIIISVLLNPMIPWRSPIFNFTIISAVIHCCDLSTFESSSPLNHFPLVHTYYIRKSEISFLSSKILIRVLIPIEIPLNQELVTTVKLKISGARFSIISFNEGENYICNGTEVEFNTVVNHDMIRNNIWNLEISIHPSFVSAEDYTLLIISSEIHGVFQEATSIRGNELHSHPIPNSIMQPILIFIFFCVPYYHVFKEETEKNATKMSNEKVDN